MPESWLRFSRAYADFSGRFPKTGEARWQKLEILLQQYTEEEVQARLKAWCFKRTDRDMSWAVDDFLGGEVHVINPDDDSDVARMATGEYIRAESEKACAKMEAEREKEREAAMARFDALSREEKLAELKAKLADNEQWITNAKAGSALAGWALEQKAKLEQQIAELSSPLCQEEISLSPEEEIQLLSQFPEAWDGVDTTERDELEVAA